MAQASKDRRIYRLARKDKERSRNKKQQAVGNTASFTSDGFLNHRFLPLTDKKHVELASYKKVERDFFKSLSHLSELYGFSIPDVSGYVFPLNIVEAYEQAKARLEKIDPELKLLIMQEQETFLATGKIFATGEGLFYISIYPMLLLAEHKKYRQANLLLSIFCYLYNVVGMPFYTDDYSYIGSQYEMIENYLQEDVDDYEEKEEQIVQLKRVAHFGKKIQAKISNLHNLVRFEKRMFSFQPETSIDERLLATSKCFNVLLKDYPSKNIFNSIWEGVIEPQEEERILPEYYLHFMFDYNDCLNDSLITSVSEHLNNCGVIDEPIAIQLFDRKQEKEKHDFDFEQRLFDLLNELIDLLKDISDETDNGLIL